MVIRPQHSTGTRVILSTSLIVAMELIRATEALLEDLNNPDTVSHVLGISPHLLQDVIDGKIDVTMEDVTHWIANFAEHKQYPSLHGYCKATAEGQVISSLELLIRGN